LARLFDQTKLAQMFHLLWPDATAEEHARELALILAGTPPASLPLVVFVAEDDQGTLIGFVEVGLRSHADACDPSRPVGYVEGWYVTDAWRRRGVGARLIQSAEDWARGLGCVEMASDVLLDNDGSQRAHQALGFEVVDRCVTFRKRL
jgi:aminoglycoside 6'-N-acetyltransferase I